MSTPALVLDAGALIAVARDDMEIGGLLTKAHEQDRKICVSAITLAEVVRGNGPRDAPVNQVIKSSVVIPVSEEIGRRAGRLLADARSDATVDSVVAATALEFKPGAVIVTSDLSDLRKLTEEYAQITLLPV